MWCAVCIWALTALLTFVCAVWATQGGPDRAMAGIVPLFCGVAGGVLGAVVFLVSLLVHLV